MGVWIGWIKATRPTDCLVQQAMELRSIEIIVEQYVLRFVLQVVPKKARRAAPTS